MSDLITRTEAAALVGVSSDTLARWHSKKSHDFPTPVAWTSSRKFYSRAEIVRWLRLRVKARSGRALTHGDAGGDRLLTTKPAALSKPRARNLFQHDGRQLRRTTTKGEADGR